MEAGPTGAALRAACRAPAKEGGVRRDRIKLAGIRRDRIARSDSSGVNGGKTTWLTPGMKLIGAAVWATATDDNKTRDAMKPVFQGNIAALSIVASLPAEG
jgi:hypothetical protein